VRSLGFFLYAYLQANYIFGEYLDYELVRIHHPDCAAARKLLPGTSHIHFQAISDAYVVLTGKRPSSSWSRNSSSPSSSGYASDTAFYEEITRRKRAQWRAPAGSDEFGYGPDVWDKKEKEMFDQGTLVFIMVFVSAQVHILGRD